MDPILLIALTVFILVSISIARAAVHGYRLFGGLRLVTCPETAHTAIVKIQATRAMVSKLAGRNNVRLQSCSRWPGRQGCDQACLSKACLPQIAPAPDGSRTPALSVRPRAPRPEGWVSDEFVGTRSGWSPTERPRL